MRISDSRQPKSLKNLSRQAFFAMEKNAKLKSKRARFGDYQSADARTNKHTNVHLKMFCFLPSLPSNTSGSRQKSAW